MMARVQDRWRDCPTDLEPEQEVWEEMRHQACLQWDRDPCLRPDLDEFVLRPSGFAAAIARLASRMVSNEWRENAFFGSLIEEFLAENGRILRFACLDLLVAHRRLRSGSPLHPFLRSRQFHGLLCQRICNGLWLQDRVELAMHIHAATVARTGIAIHPSVDLGHGIVVADGGSIYVGEGARIGNNVRFATSVVVCRSEMDANSNGPRISDGAVLQARSRIVGPVSVGTNATVSEGSVVLQDVAAFSIVRGNPAVAVGRNKTAPLPKLD